MYTRFLEISIFQPMGLGNRYGLLLLQSNRLHLLLLDLSLSVSLHLPLKARKNGNTPTRCKRLRRPHIPFNLFRGIGHSLFEMLRSSHSAILIVADQ